MTDRYALVDADGLVTNVVLWDGVAEWAPEEGVTAMAAPAEAGPGWTLHGGVWSPPQEEA